MLGPSTLAAAAAGAALHTLSLSDGHSGLVVDGCGTHALLNLAGHGQERLLNIGCTLRRRFQEGNAKAVRKFLHGSSEQRP
jgi:hypothetical protein